MEASWPVLEGSQALLEASWPILAPSWRILEASWGVLEASWAPKIHRTRWTRCTGNRWRTRSSPSLGFLRIFFGCYVYISLVYPGEKEVIKKDKRRKGRLGYRTLYAMRRHKAWRGGKAQQSCVPATALGVWLFVNRMRS